MSLQGIFALQKDRLESDLSTISTARPASDCKNRFEIETADVWEDTYVLRHPRRQGMTMTDTYTMEVSIKRAVTRVVQAAAGLVPTVCRCNLMILGSILMALVQ